MGETWTKDAEDEMFKEWESIGNSLLTSYARKYHDRLQTLTRSDSDWVCSRARQASYFCVLQTFHDCQWWDSGTVTSTRARPFLSTSLTLS